LKGKEIDFLWMQKSAEEYEKAEVRGWEFEIGQARGDAA